MAFGDTLARGLARAALALAGGPVETRLNTTSATYARAFGLDGAGHTARLTTGQAENLAAILAAVNAIAQTVAGLPPTAYRTEGGVRTELPASSGHWLPRLLRDPSQHWSWSEVCEGIVADCLLHGNALCEVIADAGGRVVRLEPIPWTAVSVGATANGALCYDVTGDVSPAGVWDGSGRGRGVRRLLAADVVHFRDRTDAGHIVARSRIVRAAAALQNAHSLQEMTGQVWHNGVFGSGFFSVDTILKREHRAQLKEHLSQFLGAPNAGKHMLLEGGLKYHGMDVRPDLLQALPSRVFATQEVARIMGVPTFVLHENSHSTYTNSEQMLKFFASFTVVPWAKRIEGAIQRNVIGNDSALSVELDSSALLKGNELERWNANKVAVEIGAVEPDEIREQEGWGPRRTATAAPRPPAAPAVPRDPPPSAPAPPVPATPRGAEAT